LLGKPASVGAEPSIFGIPGGAILPAYDPLMDSTKMRHILVRHEQGAGHAAEGYAAATGGRRLHGHLRPRRDQPRHPARRCHMDSVPMVAITGQVNRAAIGTDAFQEADIRGITMPITKHNFLVTDPDDIPRSIAEAFHIASTGRPGPVLVDISQGRAAGAHHLRLAAASSTCPATAEHQAARQADPRGRPLIAEAERRCSTSAAA
jgi:acetolactate synthase-1/2/3 large subunit